jgi:glycolate dehydrogenase FAD-binding subunit
MNAMTHPAIGQFIERVRAAAADTSPLFIRGGATKFFYGGAPVGDPLDTTSLCGISSYEPSELVITALAGTTLAELEATLAERNQYLPFEPPHFNDGGTVGGMVAAGLSGPARASVGSVRDYVLGATLLNGRAELLTFGGQVMKNVAGYDVSRVLAGSLGVLGLITAVSLKVMPIAPAEVTLEFELNEIEALRQLNTWAGQPLPLSASCWTTVSGTGTLYLRLRGAIAAVEAICRRLGGRRMVDVDATALWRGCRDHTAPWFTMTRGEYNLWRISVPQTAPVLPLTGTHLVEWHGGLRWYYLPPGQEKIVRDIARATGGHATLFRPAIREAVGTDIPATQPFDSLSLPLARVHHRLKHEFDPLNVFNRGRLYSVL